MVAILRAMGTLNVPFGNPEREVRKKEFTRTVYCSIHEKCSLTQHSISTCIFNVLTSLFRQMNTTLTIIKMDKYKHVLSASTFALIVNHVQRASVWL